MNLSKKLSLLISLLLFLLLAAWPLNLPERTESLGPSSQQSVFIISENKAYMINHKLIRLADAMSEFEGWNPADPRTGDLNSPSISYKNHNPGNLRWSPFMIGAENGFAVFETDEIGKFALLWDIWKKARGETSTGLSGESTIRDLIYKWTADEDAIKEKYLTHIESRTGFSQATKLKNLIQ